MNGEHGKSASVTTETMAWQPIATAPLDQPLLLYSRAYGIVEGEWSQVDGGGHPDNGPPVFWWESPHVEFCDGPYDAPTHWMPRPVDPPETETEGIGPPIEDCGEGFCCLPKGHEGPHNDLPF